MSDRDNDIKILEFCGWGWATNNYRQDELRVTGKRKERQYDSVDYSNLPRLNESLDAFNEFVIPAMKAIGSTLTLVQFRPDYLWRATFDVDRSPREYEAYDESPARAIVAATVAYIDGQGEGSK